MKKRALGLLLLLLPAFAAPASAREPAILDILSASRVAGYVVWDAVPAEKGKKLKCLVSRGDGGDQLDIYLGTGRENRLLLTHRLGDRLVAMFATADPGGDLVVATAGGGGGRVLVFSADHGRVRKVLDEETKGVPEVVRVEGDEKPAIVTFTDSGDKGRPLHGVVHRWNGKKYLAGSLTAEEFLQRLQKPKPPEPVPAEPSPAAKSDGQSRQ